MTPEELAIQTAMNWQRTTEDFYSVNSLAEHIAAAIRVAVAEEEARFVESIAPLRELACDVVEWDDACAALRRSWDDEAARDAAHRAAGNMHRFAQALRALGKDGAK